MHSFDAIQALKKGVDQSSVAKPEVWWPEARKKWGKAAQAYSLNYKTIYEDPAQILEVLQSFSNEAKLFGPVDRSKIGKISQGQNGATVIETDGFRLEAPIASMSVMRAGLAKWNTWLLVRFAQVPSIWAANFPPGKAWAMIAHSTSAFCTWRELAPNFPYQTGDFLIENTAWMTGEDVDLFILDDEPWPSLKGFPELWSMEAVRPPSKA